MLIDALVARLSFRDGRLAYDRNGVWKAAKGGVSDKLLKSMLAHHLFTAQAAEDDRARGIRRDVGRESFGRGAAAVCGCRTRRSWQLAVTGVYSGNDSCGLDARRFVWPKLTDVERAQARR